MAERNVARDEDAKRAKVEAQEKAVAEASMEQPATAAEKRRDDAVERKRARADAINHHLSNRTYYSIARRAYSAAQMVLGELQAESTRGSRCRHFPR